MAKSSRIIDGLKTNTLYSFQVKAKNTMGVWSDLPTAVTRTTLKDTTTPAVLSSISLLMLSGMFQLKWSKPSTLDLRGGGFKIYVYTTNTPASAVLIREVGYTADSAVILVGEKSQDASITITAGTTYYFWVTTLDCSGNESAKVATTPGSGSVTATAAAGATFNRGGTILLPSDGTNIIVWNASFACTVLAVKGYRSGGTGATVNAQKNGASTHLATNLSLTSANTWMDGGTVQNTAYAINDKLEIMVVTATGSPTQVAVQVDFMRS